jgi:hypothetical protein
MPANQVSATAVIAAPPEQLFALLTDPAQHPLIDGTDSVLGVQDGGPARLTLGSKFGMNMKIGAPRSPRRSIGRPPGSRFCSRSPPSPGATCVAWKSP